MGVFGHPVGVCKRLVHHLLLEHVVEEHLEVPLVDHHLDDLCLCHTCPVCVGLPRLHSSLLVFLHPQLHTGI